MTVYVMLWRPSHMLWKVCYKKYFIYSRKIILKDLLRKTSCRNFLVKNLF